MKLGNQEFSGSSEKPLQAYGPQKTVADMATQKINMRGFQAANVAVMINGVPINDMEWGGGLLEQLGRP